MKKQYGAYLLIFSQVVIFAGSILKIMLLPGATLLLAAGVISFIISLIIIIYRMARHSNQ